MGVNIVRIALGKTDYLVPNINENDREPSWDGNVEVYHKAGNTHNKEDLILRVTIQVKGHISSNLRKKTISYSVDIADFRNYLNDGGTVFLVVYTDEEGERSQIYYNSLLPYDLRKIIDKYGHQKTKRITLQALPKKKDEIADVFLFAAHHIKKQKSAINCDPVSIEELIETGKLSEITFGYTSTNKEIDPIDYMLDHETYIYAKLPFGIELPIDHIQKFESAGYDTNMSVSVNGEVFYNQVGVTHITNKVVLKIGESTTVTIDNKTQNANFSFSLSGALSQRIIDEDYMIRTIEAKKCEINEIAYNLTNLTQEKIDAFQLSERKLHLEWLKSIQALLKELDVTEELDCDAVSAEDDDLLHVLVESVLGKKYVVFDSFNKDDYFPEFSIANLRIKLCAYTENEKTIFFNYSNAPLTFGFTNGLGESIEASYHVFLKKESMLSCCNINYNKLVNHIKSYPITPDYSDPLIALLLHMLDAYDEYQGHEKIKQDILNGAINLAEWLKSFDKYASKDLLDLNYYQTIKRSRALNADDVQVLHSIIESIPTRKDIYVGAYILLDDFLSAENHFKELSKKEQKAFLSYPINRLWHYEDQ